MPPHMFFIFVVESVCLTPRRLPLEPHPGLAPTPPVRVSAPCPRGDPRAPTSWRRAEQISVPSPGGGCW